MLHISNFSRNIMGKARHLDLEDLKQLEHILNEGLVSVMENKVFITFLHFSEILYRGVFSFLN